MLTDRWMNGWTQTTTATLIVHACRGLKLGTMEEITEALASASPALIPPLSNLISVMLHNIVYFCFCSFISLSFVLTPLFVLLYAFISICSHEFLNFFNDDGCNNRENAPTTTCGGISLRETKYFCISASLSKKDYCNYTVIGQ